MCLHSHKTGKSSISSHWRGENQLLLVKVVEHEQKTVYELTSDPETAGWLNDIPGDKPPIDFSVSALTFVGLDVFAVQTEAQTLCSSSPIVAAASIIYKCEYLMMTSG